MELTGWAGVAVAAVVGVLADEILDWSPKAANLILDLAVRLMPAQHQERVGEEWRRALQDTPGKLSKVLNACRLLFQAGVYRGSATRRVGVELAHFGFAGTILASCAPIMLIIACAIWLEDGGPIMFGRTMAGPNGQRIVLWKFRTMSLQSDSHDSIRASKVGRFLRRRSIDELPFLLSAIRYRIPLLVFINRPPRR